MTGEYIRQYTGLLTDWSVAAFTSATLDWLFGLHDTESHLLNVFSAMLQFTLCTFMIHELVFTLGMRKPTNTIQNTWITYLAVWQMSPKAVKKLTDAYYAFHRILYGPDASSKEQQ